MKPPVVRQPAETLTTANPTDAAHRRHAINQFVVEPLMIPLTRHRVRLAYAIAVTADLLQLLLGPLGWAFADELLDVAAMILTWRVLGFHPLLLPTFVIEFLPLADMLPTWTGCVALVVALRKRQQTPQQGHVRGTADDVIDAEWRRE